MKTCHLSYTCHYNLVLFVAYITNDIYLLDKSGLALPISHIAKC